MKRLIAFVLLVIFLLMQEGLVKASEPVKWNFIGEPISYTSGGAGLIHDFVVDPNNPQHLIIVSWYQAWEESFDGGKTWSNVPKDKFGLKPHENMLSTEVHYANGKFYFLVWFRLWETTDWINFKPVFDSNTAPFNDVDNFWTDGKVFYIGTGRGPSTINNFFFYSPDGGQSWENLSGAIMKTLPDFKGYYGVFRIHVLQNKLLVVVGNHWLISNNDGTFDFHKVIVGNNKVDYPYVYEINNRLWGFGVYNEQGIPKQTLWESLDGETWSLLTDKVPFPLDDNVSESANDIIYCDQWRQYIIATDANIFLVSENGKIWQFESEGLDQRTAKNANGWNQLYISGNKIYTVHNSKLYMRDYPFTIQKNVIMRINDPIISSNGKDITMEVAPMIKDSRTLLPLRFVAEALGAQVGWNNTTKKVTISLNNTTIELWIGKSSAQVNGVTKLIDAINSKVVPVIINGRTMVPIRFISENLGCTVFWSNPLKLVVIQG